MKTTMTITSKRQITIPRKIWDELHLDGVRYLDADIQDGTLRLRKADFGQEMEAFWQETEDAVRGDITDASIRRAAASARQKKRI